MRGKKSLAALIAAVAIVLVMAVPAHHAVARFFVSQILSVATGYRVDMGDMRLQSDHGAFLNAHVTRHGEPVLYADRIDIYYHLRDLLPGSAHRFGFLGVSINRPHLTIIHHKDGSYNISPGRRGGGAAPGGSRQERTPLDFTARVRDGTATLIDDYQYYKEARLQSVRRINADLSVKSDERTHYVVTAAFQDLRDQPIRAVGTIDYRRGYALHHVVAAAIPVKAIGNYVIDSPAARIVAGTAKNFDARMYALDVQPGMPIEYHLSGHMRLSDGQLYVNGLTSPLDDLRGWLQITDDGLSARALDATIERIPIVVAGGIYDLSNPKFQLGLQGRGELHSLKNVVAFGGRYPLRGMTQIRMLIEGPIVDPLILCGFSAPNVAYDRIPLRDARGVIALYHNVASILPLRAQYGGLSVGAHGTVELGNHVNSQVALSYSANANDLPYVGALAPGSEVAGEAIVRGTDAALGANGFLADAYDARSLGAFFSLDPQGSGTLGPFSVERNGGSLIGAYVIDRRRNTSAFWASARALVLEPARLQSLPGFALAAMPQLSGRAIDADVAGGGEGAGVTLGGRVRTGAMNVAGVPLEEAEFGFAGPLADLQISRLRVRGPWGTYDGSATYASGSLAARGNFDGMLDRLPFAAGAAVRGSMHGTIALAVRNNTVVVQTQGAHFSGASVRGIPVDAMDGTVGIGPGGMRIYSARAQIAGTTAVAAGLLGGGGTVAVSAGNAGPQTARALGFPLTAGRVALVGNLAQGAGFPSFDGAVAVTNGVAAGYPVEGSSEVHVHGDVLSVNNATVTMAGTYSALQGAVGGLRSGAPSYALSASVPAADILSAAHTLHLPTFGTTGSFGAELRIAGSGSAPMVSGPFTVHAGQINGLNFSAAHADIAADSLGVRARNGNVVVGTTRTAFNADVRPGITAFALRAMDANLADFNDFFDTGDTLAGRGKVALSLTRAGGSIGTAGDVNVKDFRYRRLPIGDTLATWASRNGTVAGNVRVGGEHGMLSASGNVALAGGASIGDLVGRSRYDIAAHLRSLDLSTWLPAFGYPTLPMTGRLNADATVRGRYPSLVLATEATLLNGTFASTPIDLLHMRAHSVGSRIALTHADLQIPALVASGTGSFGFGRLDPISFAVSASSTDLPTLGANFFKTPLGIRGALQTQLDVAGTWRHPRLTGGVDLTNAVVRGVSVPQVVASVALANRDLVVRNAEISFAKGRVAIAGALPLQVSPLRIGPPQAPFAVDFFSQGVDMSDFGPLFPHGTVIGGVVNGHIGVNGTVRSPRILGALALTNGSYVSAFETVPVTHSVANLVFNGTGARLQLLHAQLGRGSLDATGTVAFDRGATGDQLAYTLDAVTRGAALRFPAYGSGTLDSKLRLVKATDQLARLSGSATVSDAVIPFAALMAGSGGAAPAGESAAPARLPFNLAFDLGVTAGKNVAVRSNALGFGLDIGAKGHVALAGTLAKPTLDGAFNAAGGSLTFVDHVFRVQRGSVTFHPANGVVPELYAVGTTHVSNPGSLGAADITITVSGPATSPQLAFTSDPGGYSRDQIIAMLTPLGAISGIQFDPNGNAVPPGQLAGAPAAGNAQPLPPGAVRRENGTLSVGQEAFNILNAQFARSLLMPVENALGGSLGFSSVDLSLDYTGALGLSVRRPLSAKVSAVYASTFGYPNRQTYGFQYSPNEFTAAQLTFFEQSAPTSFFGSATSAITTNPNVTVGQPIGGANGFTFSMQRLFW